MKHRVGCCNAKRLPCRLTRVKISRKFFRQMLEFSWRVYFVFRNDVIAPYMETANQIASRHCDKPRHVSQNLQLDVWFARSLCPRTAYSLSLSLCFTLSLFFFSLALDFSCTSFSLSFFLSFFLCFFSPAQYDSNWSSQKPSATHPIFKARFLFSFSHTTHTHTHTQTNTNAHTQTLNSPHFLTLYLVIFFPNNQTILYDYFWGWLVFFDHPFFIKKNSFFY